jgi:hypothetical protein
LGVPYIEGRDIPILRQVALASTEDFPKIKLTLEDYFQIAQTLGGGPANYFARGLGRLMIARSVVENAERVSPSTKALDIRPALSVS